MKNVRCLRISGNFRVKGIINTHGGVTYKGNNNHVAAKQDLTGRDFTSSQCLERNLYDYQQPSPENLREVLPRFAASVPGIIRGFLEPQKGRKRMKSFRLLDAYTASEDLIDRSYMKDDEEKTRKTALFFEQGVSSKEIEGKGVNAKGEEKSDTKMYSLDNAPERRQEIDCELNFADLQLIRLSGDGAVVGTDEREEFLSELAKTMGRIGAPTALNFGKFSHIYDPFAKQLTGVLLSDVQMAALAKWYIGRLRRLFISKKKGWLRTDRDSLSVTVVHSGDVDDVKSRFESLSTQLDSIEFAKDWEKVA